MRSLAKQVSSDLLQFFHDNHMAQLLSPTGEVTVRFSLIIERQHTQFQDLPFARKMRCLRTLLSVREGSNRFSITDSMNNVFFVTDAQAGSTSTECSQLALMLKDWLVDPSLSSDKKVRSCCMSSFLPYRLSFLSFSSLRQIELARLMTQAALCRPAGIDLINVCATFLLHARSSLAPLIFFGLGLRCLACECSARGGDVR